MDLIITSSYNNRGSEIKFVTEMMDMGLQTFHLRKPKFSSRQMTEYLELLPEKYHRHVVIHSHHSLAKKFKLKGIHLSKKHLKNTWKRHFKRFLWNLRPGHLVKSRTCHQLAHLIHESSGYNYVFLSPVFDGISKNQQSGFSERSIKAVLEKSNARVYAMGGIDVALLAKAREMGFHGVVMMGAIWKGKQSPTEIYLQAVEEINRLEREASVPNDSLETA